MPKPWTSLAFRKSNVGTALTTRQVSDLRKDGDISTLGQLVSDRGRDAMRTVLKMSDAAIDDIIAAVTPASAKVSMGPPAPREKAAQPADGAPPPSTPAAPVDMRVEQSEGGSRLGMATGEADVVELSAVPEAEAPLDIMSDKEVANGVGLFAAGSGRLLPAAAIGPIAEQASLATSDDGTSSAQIASQFEPVTGSSNTLPQNRDGDDGQLALTRASKMDTGNVFGAGGASDAFIKGTGDKKKKDEKGKLPAGVSTSRVGGGDDERLTASSIGDAVKNAIKSLTGKDDAKGGIKSLNAQPEEDIYTDLTNELRGFLPIAGASDVMPPAGSDELKKENLSIAFSYKPPGWPNDVVNNPLALNNRIELGIRWAGVLNALAPLHPGGSLTQGARVYESYQNVTNVDLATMRSKRKLGTRQSMDDAVGPAKRARMDGSFTTWNAATQGITDGLYETAADANPLMSVLEEEVGLDDDMPLRLNVWPCAAENVAGQPGAFSVSSGGVPLAVMNKDDYNPICSHAGISRRIYL